MTMPSAFLAILLWALQEPPIPAPIPEQAPTEASDVGQEVGPETVAVSVGDVLITLAEVSAEVNRLIPLNFYHGEVPVEKKREFRDRALENIIERTLIRLDALRRGLEASDEELRLELRRSIQTAGALVDDEMFESLLVQMAPVLTMRVLIDENEARFTASVPAVTEEDLQAAYSEQEAHLVTPELIQVREILLNVTPGSTEEQALAIKARLQLILDDLAQGGDFETLAMLHSEHESAPQGGDRGLLMLNRMRAPELSAAMAELADGEYSQPVRTRWGYHVILRERTDPARKLGFEEVRDGLRMQLANSFRDQARKAWLDELRMRFPVDIRDIVKDAPDEETVDQAAEPSEARAER